MVVTEQLWGGEVQHGACMYGVRWGEIYWDDHNLVSHTTSNTWGAHLKLREYCMLTVIENEIFNDLKKPLEVRMVVVLGQASRDWERE